MLSVIEFLEKVGSDARLRHAPRDEMELALTDTDIEPGLQTAILAEDSLQLQGLLGQGPLFSVQLPSEEGDEEDESEEEDQDEPLQGNGRSALRSVRSATPSVA